MGDEGLWMIVVLAVLLAVCAWIVISTFTNPGKVRAKRRRRMGDLAEDLGLRYYGEAPAAALSSLPPCSLFRKWPAKAVKHLISDRRRPPGLLVFDFEHVSPRGQSSTQAGLLYLVAMARLRDVPVPTAVRVYQKDWFGGPVGVRGLYSLGVGDDLAFLDDQRVFE